MIFLRIKCWKMKKFLLFMVNDVNYRNFKSWNDEIFPQRVFKSCKQTRSVKALNQVRLIQKITQDRGLGCAATYWKNMLFSVFINQQSISKRSMLDHIRLISLWVIFIGFIGFIGIISHVNRPPRDVFWFTLAGYSSSSFFLYL